MKIRECSSRAVDAVRDRKQDGCRNKLHAHVWSTQTRKRTRTSPSQPITPDSLDAMLGDISRLVAAFADQLFASRISENRCSRAVWHVGFCRPRATRCAARNANRGSALARPASAIEAEIAWDARTPSQDVRGVA